MVRRIFILLLVSFLIIIGLLFLSIRRTYQDISIPTEYSEFKYESVDLKLNDQYRIDVPAGAEIIYNPKYFTLLDGVLSFKPIKDNYGVQYVGFKTRGSEYSSVKKVSYMPTEINWDVLHSELKSYLGDKYSNFGIFVYDFATEENLITNQDKLYPPASISKLPSVFLTLIDIENGKRSYDDQITIQSNLKHGSYDIIARKPAGSTLPLRTFIEEAIISSNNTAHYHLHSLLGGAGPVRGRTKTELGAANFSLDPHLAKVGDVGEVWRRLYKNELFSKETTQYVYSIFNRAYSDLKQALPEGLPAGVNSVNKVGFLFGGKEGNTYADSGIVFGKNRDFVIVILNDKAPNYPNGIYAIQDLVEIIYKRLDV